VVREIGTLHNTEVISITEGRRLGSVSQAAYDLGRRRLLGLILGKGPAEKGILASDLKTIGPDAVMVEEAAMAKPLSELPELLQARRDPELPPQQVVTDGGQRLGHMGRVYLEENTLELTRFEISGGAWRDLTEGVLSMPVVEGIVHGPDTIILPSGAVRAATESAGLLASVEKAADSLREGGKHLGKAMESGTEALKKTLATPLAKPRAKSPPAPAAPDAASTTPDEQAPVAGADSSEPRDEPSSAGKKED
jgi:uncharacterized protein YrrD